MAEAIRLAMLGRGQVEPNPMVGCVIVRDGRIIARGYHHRFGQPHAERDALANCTQSPAGATAYVTLEPCCHTHKKTPPCVPALIQAGLSRIVVGCSDPNPQVNGRGLAQLRDAGIGVQTGVLVEHCRQLLAPFIARVSLGRPYVTLKWAQSADGKVAGAAGHRVAITGSLSNAQVHRLRARSDAILVGVGTATNDDPLLTVRPAASVDAPTRTLTRIILDTNARLPLVSQLVKSARQVPTRLYCDVAMVDAGPARQLTAAGVQVIGVAPTAGGRVSLNAVLADLGRLGMTHLMVEPGPTLAASFLQQNLADRIWLFQSKRVIGEPTAPDAPVIPDTFIQSGRLSLGEDTLTELLNRTGDVYFAPDPSADFQLVHGIDTPIIP